MILKAIHQFLISERGGISQVARSCKCTQPYISYILSTGTKIPAGYKEKLSSALLEVMEDRVSEYQKIVDEYEKKLAIQKALFPAALKELLDAAEREET